MKSMKLNGEARRRVPYGTQAGACSLKVPLFTDSPEGEWLEGLIRVPARLARATPDTNEKHGFDRLVREQLKRWNDYRVEYEAGRLSLAAKRLMDALIRRHPLYTREWRAEGFMLEPGRTREFERAVAELQQALFVVKVEERYEPSFSYRWDLLEAWLPDAVREGRRLPRPAR